MKHTKEDRSNCGCAPSCCAEAKNTQTIGQVKSNAKAIRQHIRQSYGAIATGTKSSCGCSTSCCDSVEIDYPTVARKLGYSSQQINSLDAGGNLGLGCGNPQAIANLKPGETVLDLGSGAGFDAFLAAQKVGKNGFVYGVDMTAAMVDRARQNALLNSIENVSFHEAEIEVLPLASNLVDVIISNCVINLSPEKEKVFAEAFRVLKPGGRLAVSDIVTLADLPERLQTNLESIAGCVGGASSFSQIETMIQNAGFEQINIQTEGQTIADDAELNDYIASAAIKATKPQ